MRPVDKKNPPTDDQGVERKYLKYTEAREDLIRHIGQFCSYCNVFLPASLAVEHVQPKSIVPELEIEWSNFLLACTNCNATKGNKTIKMEDYYWADIHNTHIPFLYYEDGRVEINDELNEEEKAKAQKTLDLVGLQKYPSTKEAADRRWKNRIEAFKKAIETRKLLDNIPAIMADLYQQAIVVIADSAHSTGFFSVWYKVFDKYPEVKATLIHRFEGTDKKAFDENNNFLPIKRTEEM